METRTLRYFLAIAREENMTAAANLLHISQSALSRQMSELEAELGKTLFLRTNRKTLLTEDGMRLRQRAEEIVALIDKTEMEFTAPGDDISGEIHIGAGETRAFSLIAEAIHRTQAKHPHITFSIHSANALDVTERLEHGTLDFGLLFLPIAVDHYDYVDLPYADRLGLLVRKDHPLAEKSVICEQDLLNEPLIVSSRFSTDTVLSHLSPDIRSRLQIRTYYNLIYNASLLVEAGTGTAFCIDGLIYTDENTPLRFIPLDPPVRKHTIFAWKKYRLLSKACEIFLEEFRSVCEEAEKR